MNAPDQLAALATLTHESGLSFDQAQKEFKKRLIENALTRHHGNQCAAAKELQVHRNTLSRSIEMLKLDASQFRTTRAHGGRKQPARARGESAEQIRNLFRAAGNCKPAGHA